jgi:hypothetical protein
MVLPGLCRAAATGARSTGETEIEVDRELYVITSVGDKVISGVVEATSAHDALCQVINDPQLLFDGEADGREIQARLPEELAGQWREMAPCRPTRNGDHSEYQQGDSFSRRWAMPRPDGLWAVTGITWFVSDDSDCDARREDAKLGKMLEREEEYMVCEDLRGIGATEHECDYVYAAEDDYPLTEAGAVQACAAFEPFYIAWDGLESPQQVGR